MRIRLMSRIICAALLVGVMGCNDAKDETSASASSSGGGIGALFNRFDVPAGATLTVRLENQLSSENVHEGDTFAGTVTRSVFDDDKVVIPEGSTVQGVIVGAKPAKRGDRAMLDLAIRRVTVDGRSHSVSAQTDEIIAGSTRARNLGAIAGGAAAGALLGKAIGGDSRDATRGAVIGGVVATGAVAASKGYQVVLPEGTVINFTVGGTS